eukprot:CFRG2113T1
MKMYRRGVFTSVNKMRRILLTGATGMVGGSVLRDILLLDPLVEVGCVVRGGSESRLRDQLQKSGLWPISTDGMKQVHVLDGDTSVKNLGMTSTVYREWVNTADAVVHLAANIHLRKSASSMHEVNVNSTQFILDFASSGTKCKKDVHYLSSYASCFLYVKSTAGALIPETLSMSRWAAGPGYGRNKWDAEQMIAKQSQKLGLRSLIYRVPFVLGFQQKSVVLALIQLAVVTGAMHDWTTFCPIFPLKPTSQAMAALSLRPLDERLSHNNGKNMARVAHLMQPKQDLFADQAAAIFEALNLPYDLSVVSTEEFRCRLDAVKGMNKYVDSIARVAYSLSLEMAQYRIHPFETTETKALLASCNIDLETAGKCDSKAVKTLCERAVQDLYNNVDADTLKNMHGMAVLASQNFRQPSSFYTNLKMRTVRTALRTLQAPHNLTEYLKSYDGQYIKGHTPVNVHSHA